MPLSNSYDGTYPLKFNAASRTLTIRDYTTLSEVFRTGTYNLKLAAAVGGDSITFTFTYTEQVCPTNLSGPDVTVFINAGLNNQDYAAPNHVTSITWDDDLQGYGFTCKEGYSGLKFIAASDGTSYM